MILCNKRSLNIHKMKQCYETPMVDIKSSSNILGSTRLNDLLSRGDGRGYSLIMVTTR